jgi:hypothetical protein
MIKICAFKEKVKEDPNSVAYGRFQCLVALERFQTWWPLEERKTSFSFLFIFPLTNFTYTFYLSIDLRFYLPWL